MRLLNTGDGLGEKLALTKSHMFPAPPFKPREFCEEDVVVPKRPCSCFGSRAWAWGCCDAIPDSRDWDRDCDNELRGEADRDDDELREDDRASEPGMFTGADPANNR